MNGIASTCPTCRYYNYIYRAVQSKNVMVKLIVYNNESATGVVPFSVQTYSIPSLLTSSIIQLLFILATCRAVGSKNVMVRLIAYNNMRELLQLVRSYKIIYKQSKITNLMNGHSLYMCTRNFDNVHLNIVYTKKLA